MKIEIADISLGDTKRYRSELKNIAKLAKSMSKPNGQLQPICVDCNGELIFGLRRLEAAKSLGWKEIEAVVVDLDNPLEAIQDENDDREAWPVSDRVALGKAIEEHEKEKAKERQQEAGKQYGKGKPIASEKFSEAMETGRAKDKAAEAAGMSRPTYEKAKEVIETAKTNPAVAPIAEEMDKTGKVAPAHKAMQEVLDSKPSEDETPWVDAWGIPITKEAEPAFRNAEKFDELLKLLRQAKKLYKELADLPGGELLRQPFVSSNSTSGFRHNGLETCIMNVSDCKPKYTVCPYVYHEYTPHDKNCTFCKGLGWIGTFSKSSPPPQDFIDAAKRGHGVQV